MLLSSDLLLSPESCEKPIIQAISIIKLKSREKVKSMIAQNVGKKVFEESTGSDQIHFV